MNVVKMIKLEEGYRERPYHCTEGFVTVGIGWKIGPKGADLENYKCMAMCEKAAEAQAQNKIDDIHYNLLATIPFYAGLNEPRAAVLVSMVYQMGISGVLRFKKMLAAIEAGDFDAAYTEGLDSRWASQTPERAIRQMRTMQTGTWSEYE